MSFNSLILFWFDNNKRSLPWRGQSEVYKIWVSEIILQQTRVNQGTEYYLRFIKRFPTLEDLATADEKEILKLWQGLGYYSRARNLHFSTKYIFNKLNGKFPDNYKDLLKLKGIGEYTAAAIASISFGETVPAIDGNAFRVFARYFNIELDISAPKTRKYFFELGKEIIDSDRPGDFNEAVMELGATVCLPKNPKCEICPLNESCQAFVKKKIKDLPVKRQKIKVKTRTLNFIEITDGENYLMVKRTTDDIWKNLYSFPVIEEKVITTENLDLTDFNKNLILIHNEVHLLTHQRLEINFFRLNVNLQELKKISRKLNVAIYSYEEIFKLPVPKPIEKYLNSKI